MNTKKIHEALAAMKSCIKSGEPWTWEMERAYDAAKYETESVERAAKVLAPADCPNVLPRDEAERAWDLIRRIAKDAP